MYRVLHIEQSSFFVKIVSEIVENKKYAYINTESFKEAESILVKEEIDLIITSLYSIDGIIEDFVKIVNEKYDIPIFIVTGDDVDENRKDLINLGISEYILKKDLEEEMKKHIDAVFRDDEYINNLRKAKIAIVEDNALLGEIEKQMLLNYGIKNIDYYSSGKNLFESDKKYDIYLIDIILKNEFGKDVIRKLRRNNIDSSIIAVTSLDNDKALANILDSGANDYITKPINENIFIAKLKSNIRVHGLYNEILKLKNK